MMLTKHNFLAVMFTLVLTTQPILQPTVVAAQPPVNTSAKVADKLPSKLLRVIQRDIQKRFKVSPQTLRLTNARRATWDSCMGLAQPNRLCTQIAISGWQVIVSNKIQNRFWIYHVDDSGKRLGFNSTASSPRVGQTSIPNFINPQKIIPTSSSSVIFQSAQITGFSPQYYAWELTSDGVLTRRTITQNPGKPEKIKQLTQEEVQQFISVLEKNSFSHFNGLSYLNMGAIAADAASFQLSFGGATVEYTNPGKLAPIVSAWENLISRN
ncbi:hypothetical protein [Calothrix sp. 336/3]|uniref:hypothetical protein n=1 Tax=Calothrix sp. 336/3 TaxID=1337936 RepID=UPI0004E34D76|nr:hypothetical protein [Calothrix sp. 336/3]AKG20157.1 hypothetical protein IJ00_01515 [Calothrix sp. 336/3]